ncbi:MAG: glutathione S-transferase N-terminal domain-containing protein [Amylibacter sp.]|nr:glutathione S-transferase N-terminal domain-containing protein [Amylibacter sp.]
MGYGAAMTFILYHHGSSVCAAKVRFAMAEKGMEWEGVYIDILAGEQFTPEYQKINPKSVVPTLVHDDLVIPDSTVISNILTKLRLKRLFTLRIRGRERRCGIGLKP